MIADRFHDGMIITSGDEVLWDGEALALGVPPFKTVAEIDAANTQLHSLSEARPMLRDPDGKFVRLGDSEMMSDTRGVLTRILPDEDSSLHDQAMARRLLAKIGVKRERPVAGHA